MHKDFNEEQLEKVLKNAPKVEDNRTKEDVLNRLKAEGIFEEIGEQPATEKTVVKEFRKKNSKRWMGAIAAVAAAAIIVPIAWFALDKSVGDEAANHSPEMMGAFDVASDMDVGSIERAEKSEETNIATIRMMDLRQNLYEDELVDEVVLTIGFTSNDAESVPLSMKMDASSLAQYGIAEDATYLELYRAIAPKINEEAMGFLEAHPLVGELYEDGSTLIHRLPANHLYDGSSAQMANYFGLLQDTFGEHYERVVVQDESGNPIEFSEVGPLEPIQLSGLANQMNYFLYTNEEGMTYLSPNFRQTFETVESALAALYEETNDIYQTAMLPNITFTTNVHESYIEIVFDRPLDVTEYVDKQLMQMLEAIILTGAAFDYQVKFTNIVQEAWSGFQFTNIMPKVIGVNEVPFILE